MDETEAFELIDAHLDRQPLTDEQSDALTAWISADPRRADEAFYRIFLHSYLRTRLQAGLLVGSGELTVVNGAALGGPADSTLAIDPPLPQSTRRLAGPRRRRPLAIALGSIAVLLTAAFGFWSFSSRLAVPGPAEPPYAYEGFDYPATGLPKVPDSEFKWPTTGGLNGLAGGTGWDEPWEETNSKVAIVVDYSDKEMHWEPADMRKFGPLGYSDARGNVLQFSGHQMRTATSPRSITMRRFDPKAFPESMRDEGGLGKDGSVLWISLLAQSSLSTAERNRYSYLVIGSKSVAGFRIGKLGAAPSGNWTAVGLMTGAEVNLKSSTFPSGEMVLLVTRIVFRPGPEDALVWINPKLDEEPSPEEASLHLQVPDFRFDGAAIHANHSTDFDELRFGGTFRSVAPIR